MLSVIHCVFRCPLFLEYIRIKRYFDISPHPGTLSLSLSLRLHECRVLFSGLARLYICICVFISGTYSNGLFCLSNLLSLSLSSSRRDCIVVCVLCSRLLCLAPARLPLTSLGFWSLFIAHTHPLLQSLSLSLSGCVSPHFPHFSPYLPSFLPSVSQSDPRQPLFLPSLLGSRLLSFHLSVSRSLFINRLIHSFSTLPFFIFSFFMMIVVLFRRLLRVSCLLPADFWSSESANSRLSKRWLSLCFLLPS